MGHLLDVGLHGCENVGGVCHLELVGVFNFAKEALTLGFDGCEVVDGALFVVFAFDSSGEEFLCCSAVISLAVSSLIYPQRNRTIETKARRNPS